jgi:signal transduction histidine kinase
VVECDLAFLADADRLQQLLENLFRNAVEHGGEEVTVQVGALDDASGFYVADNGVGIPEESQGKVFDSGYSSATDGTGFGLAIVKEIVDAHGWMIRVTENSEGGARFEITGIAFPDG